MKALMVAGRVVLTDRIDMVAFSGIGNAAAAVWICGRPEPLQAQVDEVAAIKRYVAEVMGSGSPAEQSTAQTPACGCDTCAWLRTYGGAL